MGVGACQVVMLILDSTLKMEVPDTYVVENALRAAYNLSYQNQENLAFFRDQGLVGLLTSVSLIADLSVSAKAKATKFVRLLAV